MCSLGAGTGFGAHSSAAQRHSWGTAWGQPRGSATIGAELLDGLVIHSLPCRGVGSGSGDHSFLFSSSDYSAIFISQHIKGHNTQVSYLREVAHWEHLEFPRPPVQLRPDLPSPLGFSSLLHLKKGGAVAFPSKGDFFQMSIQVGPFGTCPVLRPFPRDLLCAKSWRRKQCECRSLCLLILPTQPYRDESITCL